jgi:hypothetical protein
MSEESKRGFCIFINTLSEGSVPSVRNGDGFPCVFENELAAQREIADCLLSRLNEFFDGMRDFEDAITVEEYVVDVDVLPDGSVIDESGYCFGNEECYRGRCPTFSPRPSEAR